MFVRSLFATPAISVGELWRRIRSAVEAAFVERVRVAGEIAECSVSTLGHVFFSLKEREAFIKCVCFRDTARSLDMQFPLADGSAVEVTGRVTVYKVRSHLQLVVDDIVPVGRGELFRRFELLKEQLQ